MITLIFNYIRGLFIKPPITYYKYKELSEEAKLVAINNKISEMTDIQNKLDWTPRLLLNRNDAESLINRFETYENNSNDKLFKSNGTLK